MSEFIQIVINGLTVGSFYALVALGYTMIYGIIRLINFAHGDIYMLGAFLGWTVLAAVSGAHLPTVVALVLALAVSMLATGVFGVFVERVAYQPLLRAPRLSILITALGVSLALENGVMLVYGAGFDTYPQNLSQAGWQIAGATVSYTQMGMFALSVLLMLALYLFVKFTPVGTAMRALALDQDAARLMGIHVERVIQLTFFIGTALAAAAGVMMGEYYTQISFMMGFLLGLRAFTAAVLGGIGNIPGAMVGGLLIGLLESFSAGYVSSQWKDVIVFSVLILVLVVKPTGIFGERVVERM
ncbi:MAG: branched-chain amino acid ABC transporter permease [Alicyclobacillus macrosporangiidus]|uniref:branched-chain amino acid ABC transporter permease n=1 Tax=Alicyclobacillus macrosporangiidus TaxID=392015 RepID=UPI0026EFEBC0|nr:branched-chain amino acid ABC transporter permease [Alicyclobacillus macrosporangiidus]MCL6601080.1 branched-chain amino acid ABC transporter permease [Alicyclobacillus macrosporangiidus]